MEKTAESAVAEQIAALSASGVRSGIAQYSSKLGNRITLKVDVRLFLAIFWFVSSLQLTGARWRDAAVERNDRVCTSR